MKVKASLHLHSQEDPEDGRRINYSLYELIDQAAKLDFKVLASTCHLHNQCQKEHSDYAKEKGILLIPGAEIELNRKHLLILNVTQEAEKIKTAEQLRAYKNSHPECLIIAPHPNHGLLSSLSLKKVRALKDVIDAVEHSWFYASFFNPNLQTEKLCAELGLPFIATADLHFLNYLNADYAIIDAAELSIAAVFEAIRQKKIKNISRPKGGWELFIDSLRMFVPGFNKIF